MTTGYEALRANQAIVDLSLQGRIRVSGEDRARLLHALTTNHIQQMNPGEEVYAFFLTAQGRIISDVHAHCYEDSFLLDVESEAREHLQQHIDHYIIADDVTLEDVSASTFGLLAAGKRIYGDVRHKAETIVKLGLMEATSQDARAFRIDNFHPRFGEDFTSATLPQETGLPYALHFQKGCYLGQEIVERIRSRGHVNKMLAGLKLERNDDLTVGAKILFQGEEAGQITSVHTLSAIAMLRIQAAKPGTVVQVGAVSAEVVSVS